MTDNELLTLIKKGNKSAFDDLVNTYSSRVASIAYSLLSDREDALDAAQEVFIRVHKGISAFRGECSISTWIFRITKNVCNDFLRKRRFSAMSLDDDGDGEQKTEIPDDTNSPEHLFERNAKIDAVRSAIAELDDTQRLVITLFDINGLSYEEIAVIMQCPIGTVKSRLYRARESLRKILSANRELFI